MMDEFDPCLTCHIGTCVWGYGSCLDNTARIVLRMSLEPKLEIGKRNILYH